MALVVQTPLPAGVPLRASYLAQTIENANAIVELVTDGWTDWSSSFSIGASTTPPTLGSSTKEAWYKHIGKFVLFNFRLQVVTGGAWNPGSGEYRFALPVQAASTGPAISVGSAWANDSGTALRVGVVQVGAGATYATIIINDGLNVPLSSAGPGTAWATGDHVTGQILYQGAS